MEYRTEEAGTEFPDKFIEPIPLGYKKTEVGTIPEDWEVRIINDIANIITGPFGTLLNAAEYTKSNGVPLISVGEIGTGHFKISDSTPRIPVNVVNRLPQYILRKGDIVFGRKGNVERSAMVRQGQDGWFLGSDGINIRPNKQSNSEYLAIQFQSYRVKSYLTQNAIGTTMPSLNQEILKKVVIPFPPTEAEQEAIAKVLSDTDELIESLEKLLEKKHQIKQGAMQDLLTGKKRLPGFSGEWEIKTLAEIFEFSGGFSASRDQLSTEGFCYLHYGDIHKSSKQYINIQTELADIPKLNIALNKISPASLLEDGDVVFVDASEDDEGTSKHVVIFNKDKIPFISGLHTIVAKSKTNLINNNYKRYCFQTKEIKNQFYYFSVGTKVSGISKTNIAKLQIPVPPYAEQTTIAEILSDMDAEIAALEEKLDKYRAIKQGMMHNLLTGRIRLI